MSGSRSYDTGPRKVTPLSFLLSTTDNRVLFIPKSGPTSVSLHPGVFRETVSKAFNRVRSPLIGLSLSTYPMECDAWPDSEVRLLLEAPGENLSRSFIFGTILIFSIVTQYFL